MDTIFLIFAGFAVLNVLLLVALVIIALANKALDAFINFWTSGE